MQMMMADAASAQAAAGARPPRRVRPVRPGIRRSAIRPATAADVPQLLELFHVLHVESPRFAVLTFDGEKLQAFLAGLVDSAQGFLMVAGDVGAVYGFMGAVAVPHWASQDLVTTDVALYVAPARRGSLAALQLIEAYGDWAQRTGARMINVGVSTGIDTEGTAALYERLGFRRCGVLLEL